MAERALYAERGHLTVLRMFDDGQIEAALADLVQWADEALAALPEAQRAWYVDAGVRNRAVLRKLDNPHHHRPALRALAFHPPLVQAVESLIGPGVSVVFSQVFMKAPDGGGPKPAHQDNFYFGPSDEDGLVTAWVALDDATLQNGCLYYGDGSNHGPVYPHVAPPDEPFNLQLPAALLARQPMTPAPVRRGGVSFHHGNTIHLSGDNSSPHWRRACAFHYCNHHTRFTHPALPYDERLRLRVT